MAVAAVIPAYDSFVGRIIDVVLSPVSEHTRRAYSRALRTFFSGCSTVSRTAVMEHLAYLEQSGHGPSSINQALSALKLLATELYHRGMIQSVEYQGILALRSKRRLGIRAGNWLTEEQAQGALDKARAESSPRGERDAAILSVFLGCAMRRSELASLTWGTLQRRDDRWVFADIVGKHNRIRSVAVPEFTFDLLIAWKTLCPRSLSMEPIFRPIRKGKILGRRMSVGAINNVVKKYAGNEIAAHDLRRTFAHVAHRRGADMVQIQNTLGHASIQTTENYVRAGVDLRHPACDQLGWR